MTDRPPSPEPTSRPAASAAARPRCPRCGAAMGVLDGGGAAAAGGGAPPAVEAAFYCGCCGLVVAGH